MNEALQKKLAEAENHPARTGDFPKRWVPENAGDQIDGVLVREEEFNGPYGLTTSAVIRTEGGIDRAVVIGSSVLRTQWERADANVGDAVVIKFLGLKKSKKTGREFKDFAIAAVPGDGTIPDAKPEPEPEKRAPVSGPGYPKLPK